MRVCLSYIALVNELGTVAYNYTKVSSGGRKSQYERNSFTKASFVRLRVILIFYLMSPCATGRSHENAVIAVCAVRCQYLKTP